MDRTGESRAGKGLLWLIAVSVLLLCAAGAYLGTYFWARGLAIEGEYVKAQRRLPLPGVTALHDKGLGEYIQAGVLMESGQYNEAAKAFYKLSEEDYLDSHELMLECIYRQGMQLMEEEGKYEQAHLLLNENARNGHEESKTARKEAMYRWALQLRDEGDCIAAYEKILQLENYDKALVFEKELRTQLYVEGIEYYRQKEYGFAEQRFSLISEHENSLAYLYLIYARTGRISGPIQVMSLEAIFWFEDAPEAILSNPNTAMEYLFGVWISADGERVMSFSDSGYWLKGLPMGENGYMYIFDGKWYDLPHYAYMEKIISDGYPVLYTLKLTAPNTLEVYCHMNGESYTLHRR